jgi:hypothetical protein
MAEIYTMPSESKVAMRNTYIPPNYGWLGIILISFLFWMGVILLVIA